MYVCRYICICICIFICIYMYVHGHVPSNPVTWNDKKRSTGAPQLGWPASRLDQSARRAPAGPAGPGLASPGPAGRPSMADRTLPAQVAELARTAQPAQEQYGIILGARVTAPQVPQTASRHGTVSLQTHSHTVRATVQLGTIPR